MVSDEPRLNSQPFTPSPLFQIAASPALSSDSMGRSESMSKSLHHLPTCAMAVNKAVNSKSETSASLDSSPKENSSLLPISQKTSRLSRSNRRRNRRAEPKPASLSVVNALISPLAVDVRSCEPDEEPRHASEPVYRDSEAELDGYS
ncbi:unnamed protein product [Protopolystoma xenopodis]|uniref:Uncharacterized protein n=1 Tax=Protopolystoma xenopodis TaxID=117903 RepID=A0A448WQ62_9PLAT|nr:unnamed protein product [Protopolystoma xenopodis]